MSEDTAKIVGASVIGIAGIALIAIVVNSVSREESTDELVARLRQQRRANPSTKRARA